MCEIQPAEKGDPFVLWQDQLIPKRTLIKKINKIGLHK